MGIRASQATIRNTPSWIVSEPELRLLLDRLRGALREPQPPLSQTFQEAAGHDAHRLVEALTVVSAAAREAKAALTPHSLKFPVPSFDSGTQKRLFDLVRELSELWSARVFMALGYRKAQLLRDLLAEPCVDLLGMMRREDDENAHSDVLRWMLDPREAPSIAPHVLRALIARRLNSQPLKAALDSAISDNCVSVQREVVIGYDLGEDLNLDRIDLVISSPDFVIGIENKVGSSEHDGQTASYARWLELLPYPSCNKAGIFLTPAGAPAQSSDFSPLSYLELSSMLLDAAVREPLAGAERQVLVGYMKTLGRRILRAEFNAVAAMEGLG